jgi:glycogen(starch) synthase
MTLRPLWITENYPPDRGGMAQSCDRIVHTLRSRGVEVDVVHISRRYSEWRIETRSRGRDFLCPSEDDAAHTLNRLWNILSRQRNGAAPTHIVAFGGTLPLLAGPPYAAWLRCPLITLMRGNDFDAALFSPKRSEILRHAIRSSAAVCTVTRDHAARIAALEPGIRPQWIPNGVDPATWQLLPHDRHAAARWRSANVPPSRRLLGIFGQLKQKKGVRFFLDALERSGYADRFHLLLVGDLEEGTLREGVSSTVLPFRDRIDLLPLFAACDAVVVPSFYDGLPNVVLEAGALGIPLIASTAGGMADLLVDRVNAIVFEAGDEHDCRRAITTAVSITDDGLASLGERLRTVVLEHFNADKESQRYFDLLVEVVHAKNVSGVSDRSVRSAE